VSSTFWLRWRERLARAIGLELTHEQVSFGKELECVLARGARWLELGCGHQLIPEWMIPLERQRAWVESARIFVGVDLDGALSRHPLVQLGVKAPGESLPFRAGSFDLVTANMVVEHLPDPRRVLEEVRRVLSPHGRFVVHTPNYLYYLMPIAHWVPQRLKNRLILFLEKREAEDVFPTFYRMNTERRIRELARVTGFRVVRLHVFGNAGTFLFLGPIALLEVLWLKALESLLGGRLQSNLIAVLERLD
jgi:SAM-dependent methyltransferase